MAEWCQLPKELLQLISERLDDSPLYLLRFRSVCSTWRSSIPNPIHHHFHHHVPFKLPRFHGINNNDSNDSASTFSLSKRTIFLITPPPPPPQQHQQTLPLRPWLVEIDQDSRGRTRLRHPVTRDSLFPLCFPHVLDFNHLRVFDLGRVFFLAYPPPMNSLYPAKVVAATWQGDNEGFGSALLTIHLTGELALFRCGDERWTVFPDMPMRYDDVCVFKGRPCAVDGIGRTVTVRPDSSVDLVAEPVFGGNKKFLVESQGELLLVDKYSSSVESDRFGVVFEYECEWWEKVERFDVYRLEEKEKRWVQLTSLGDRVLFLGIDCAFSASASDLCVGRGNCVIFTDDNEYGMRAFHLEEGEISPLSEDDSSYYKLFWPPPDWLGLR